MTTMQLELVIVHGGQTGVDRGAHAGATDAGHRITGYMPTQRHDELGLIPADVAKHLRPVLHGGYEERTKINVGMCHALLVIVEDKHHPYATPGTRLTLLTAREESKPSIVVEPGEAAFAKTWLLRRYVNRPAGEFRLMVAGPRASRWANGERATFEIVRALPSGEMP